MNRVTPFAIAGLLIALFAPDAVRGQRGAKSAPATTAVARAATQRAREVELGFEAGLEQRVRALLAEAIARRVFPGAVALVAKDGAIAVETAIGRHTYAGDARAMAVGDTFDLASLSKVCATTPTVLRLCAARKLSLDGEVQLLLPDFRDDRNRRLGDRDPVPGKADVTIRHLLTHSAGLVPYERFFREVDDRASVLAAAMTSPLRSAPGTKKAYSDIGMILLMACIEKVTGESLAVVAKREVFDPLGMTGARYAPRGEPIDAVPTEVSEARGGVICGQVHDENAYALGGISGHAGLFATARDVFRLAQAYLDSGRRPGGSEWLPKELAEKAIAREGSVPDSSRALGWDTFTPGGSSGTKLAPTSFGHTGFTGTSVWCDPTRNLCIVLLTNRVHPSRANSRITPVRGAFADLVVEGLR